MNVDGNRAPSDWRPPRTWILLAKALSPLPLVAFFVYATWLNPISPYFANYDPEFQYLLNSLEVFKGSPYAYVDHPGTPLELIGSSILAATYPVLGRDPAGFIRYHLQNPGLFLTLAHGLLLLASILCIWFFIGSVSKTGARADAFRASAVAVMYFAIHPLSFSTLTLWSHNSFSFPFGTLFLVILFNCLSAAARGKEIRLGALIGLGLGAGILASVTVYLASWVITTIVVVMLFYQFKRWSWRRTLGAGFTVALSSLVGFFAMVLPVLNRMPAFFEGVSQLLAHENADPLGLAGRPLGTRLTMGLPILYDRAPALFLVMVVLALLGAAALVIRRHRMSECPELWALGAGLILQMLLLAFVILDHPVSIYLLSIAATAPVLALVILKLFDDRPAIGQALSKTFAMVVMAGYLFSFAGSIAAQQTKAARIGQVVQQTEDSLTTYAKATGRSPADLFALWSYRSYSPCFSLWFGNDSANRVFKKEIGEMCYRQYEFNIWTQKVVSSQGVSTLANTKWDVLIGCEDGFNTAGLGELSSAQTFPSLMLECGSLKIAYNRE